MGHESLLAYRPGWQLFFRQNTFVPRLRAHDHAIHTYRQMKIHLARLFKGSVSSRNNRNGPSVRQWCRIPRSRSRGRFVCCGQTKITMFSDFLRGVWLVRMVALGYSYFTVQPWHRIWLVGAWGHVRDHSVYTARLLADMVNASVRVLVETYHDRHGALRLRTPRYHNWKPNSKVIAC